MAARQTTKTIVQLKSTCEAELVQVKGADIWHYTSQGRIHWELKNHARKGRYWYRNEQTKLSPQTDAALAEIFPLSNVLKAAPVLGQRTIVGQQCEVRDITGPWYGTFCLKATRAPYPSHITLAVTMTTGKDNMLEDQATTYAEKSRCRVSVSFPQSQIK